MLDVSVRMDVLALLRSLRDQRGLTFLLITHDLASARHLADRFVVLYAGHIVESGETDAVIEGPKHPYTHRLLAAAPGSTWKTPESPSGTVLRDPQGCAFAGSCGYADARVSVAT